MKDTILVHFSKEAGGGWAMCKKIIPSKNEYFDSWQVELFGTVSDGIINSLFSENTIKQCWGNYIKNMRELEI